MDPWLPELAWYLDVDEDGDIKTIKMATWPKDSIFSLGRIDSLTLSEVSFFWDLV